MKFRSATPADIVQICALERLPEFRTLVGSWPEEEHRRLLADPTAAYLIAEDSPGEIAGFAILRGLRSEQRQVELKRLVVRTPNEGVGKKLLTEAVERAFGEHHAHRIFLDVFVTNERARDVYEKFGFRKEGIMRDAFYRDGTYHSLVLMSLLESEYRLEGEGRGRGDE
jgi:diamine N-acetyltransferase